MCEPHGRVVCSNTFPDEPHGTIVAGRWKGTRAALVRVNGRNAIVRPFNDTALTEDARIHLSPLQLVAIPWTFFERD